MEFSEMDLAGRALNLAIAAYMGNVESRKYRIKILQEVYSQNDIMKQAENMFRKTNCSTLYYLSSRSIN